MKTSALAAIFGALLVSGGLLVGCGDDDPEENPPADTGVEASADTAPTDTGTAPDAPVDSGDAGPLDFAEFVKGLIKNETKPSTTPTTVDDKTFVDKRDQSQFTELFP
jgi:hypothetical protein